MNSRDPMQALLRVGSFLGLMALAAAGLGLLPAEAATLRVELGFSAPTLSDQGDGTVIVEGPDCVTFNEPGLPLLPAQPAVVLLPPGETVTAIRVTPASEHTIEGSYRVACAQQPRPISDAGPFPPTAPDAAVYGSDALYPPAAAVTPSPISSQRPFSHESYNATLLESTRWQPGC